MSFRAGERVEGELRELSAFEERRSFAVCHEILGKGIEVCHGNCREVQENSQPTFEAI
jgi:hypothetical protein